MERWELFEAWKWLPLLLCRWSFPIRAAAAPAFERRRLTTRLNCFWADCSHSFSQWTKCCDAMAQDISKEGRKLNHQFWRRPGLRISPKIFLQRYSQGYGSRSLLHLQPRDYLCIGVHWLLVARYYGGEIGVFASILSLGRIVGLNENWKLLMRNDEPGFLIRVHLSFSNHFGSMMLVNFPVLLTFLA